MKKKEASYTVELCLILPLLLFALYTPVSMGYDYTARQRGYLYAAGMKLFVQKKKYGI